MIELLLTYKYAIIIPLSIIEGPIVGVIGGFLVTLKIFNPFVLYAVMVTGDIVGDTMIYYIGYSGKRFLKYFKVTDEKLEKAKTYFHENHKKAILMSKLVHGVGVTGLIAAGAVHVPYKRYFQTCALFSMAQSFVVLLVGIFFGQAYEVIGKYFNYYAAFASVAVFIFLFFLIVRKYKMRRI